MLDFTDITSARGAFRQLYNQVQAIFQWNLKGSKITGLGTGIVDTDAVNVGQLNDAIAGVKIASNSNSTIFDTVSNLKISVSLTPTLDNTVDIGTTALRFKKFWVYLIDVATTIIFSGLTASRPIKLNASKEVVSAKINLADSTNEVTGITAPANGGTGLATLTANAVLLGNGTGNVAFATIGTAGRVFTDNGAGINPSFHVLVIPVDSIFGRIGAVVAATNDYAFTQISGTVDNTQIPNPLKVILESYTVATLPIAGSNSGRIVTVSDALAPAWRVNVVGGGAVQAVVYCNGSSWYVIG